MLQKRRDGVDSDLTNFIGTCGEHDELPSDSCVAAATLCLRDANCIAIRDCVVTCGKDEACLEMCLTEGEPFAEDNFHQSIECAAAGDTPAEIAELLAPLVRK